MEKAYFFIFLSLFVGITLNAQQVDAGKNDTICEPGALVTLSASYSSSSSYFYSHWKPGQLFADSTKKNQTVHPTQTTTYYFAAYYQQKDNLVLNGDFQSGRTQFTSDYEYKDPIYNALWPEGTYTIAASPHLVHNNFPPHDDHTYADSRGLFLIVNGSESQNTKVWEQTVNTKIIPNTDYVFYAWVLTVNNVIDGDTEKLALLQFSINGKLLDKPFLASFPELGWQRFYVIWNSGAFDGNATIKIVNQNTGQNGNDFGLDDIYFAPILPITDSVTIYVGEHTKQDTTIKMCHGEQYDFAGRILTTSGIYEDTLRSSLGCDSIVRLTLTVADELVLDLGENIQVCRKNAKSITLGAKEQYDSYLWSDNTTDKTLTVTESGEYSLTVTNELGCTVSDIITVDFFEEVKVEIEILDEFCDDYTAELTAIDINATHYLWNTGEITSTITAKGPGQYSVRASNEKCTNEAIYTIESCEFRLYFPNTITPGNHDSPNSYFCLSSPDDVGSAYIAIYNRFGEAVYVTDNPYFKWDGKHKGQLHTSVMYTYIVKVTNKQGKPLVFTGNLLVL